MSLASYIITKLGAITAVVGWTVSTPALLLAVSEAEAIAGDDVDGQRAVGLAIAWQSVLADLAARYDFTADKATYRESQMYTQAERAAKRAMTAAAPWMPSGAVIGNLNTQDPYADRLPLGEFDIAVDD